eukprot:2027794-Pyramimonas_sp.AAC.1
MRRIRLGNVRVFSVWYCLAGLSGLPVLSEKGRFSSFGRVCRVWFSSPGSSPSGPVWVWSGPPCVFGLAVLVWSGQPGLIQA